MPYICACATFGFVYESKVYSGWQGDLTLCSRKSWWITNYNPCGYSASAVNVSKDVLEQIP